MLQRVTMVGRRLAVAKSAKACSLHNQQPSALVDIQNAQIIVGTSCAGTGIDIQSVKNVIVSGLPYSIEQLLQWAGRCREDGMVTVFVPKTHFKESNELTSII
jgi:superfamily II DNA/RNA helicase